MPRCVCQERHPAASLPMLFVTTSPLVSNAIQLPLPSKYFKMIKMGFPKDVVRHALVRDQLDSKILDMNPERSLQSQTESADGVPPIKDDPKYSKVFINIPIYFRLDLVAKLF